MNIETGNRFVAGNTLAPTVVRVTGVRTWAELPAKLQCRVAQVEYWLTSAQLAAREYVCFARIGGLAVLERACFEATHYASVEQMAAAYKGGDMTARAYAADDAKATGR